MLGAHVPPFPLGDRAHAVADPVPRCAKSVLAIRHCMGNGRTPNLRVGAPSGRRRGADRSTSDDQDSRG
jgi:hypothetical protein